jgi:hypothetical protein
VDAPAVGRDALIRATGVVEGRRSSATWQAGAALGGGEAPDPRSAEPDLPTAGEAITLAHGMGPQNPDRADGPQRAGDVRCQNCRSAQSWNIGLNGILIPEGQTERRIFLTCAKWVGETSRPVYARIREAPSATSRPVPVRVPARP